MKKGILVSMVIGVLSVTVMADPIRIGDTIRIIDREGTTGGGEFGIAHVGPNQPELFRSFCMQRDEHVDLSPAGFEVVGISEFVELQHDRIDERTAYLYTHFRMGTLSNYVYAPGGDAGGVWDRVDSANALQIAIWAIEGELAMPGAGQALDWINEAQNAIDLGHWSGLGQVRVLNLVWATNRSSEAGTPAQDVLTLLPAPGAAMLVGLGLSVIGWVRRRIA